MNNETIIYARLSREDEDKLDGKIESRSIENQIKLLTKYANEHGFKIVKVLYDDGYSGGTMDRPAFNELLKEVPTVTIGGKNLEMKLNEKVLKEIKKL